jgi:hypothetical protein
LLRPNPLIRLLLALGLFTQRLLANRLGWQQLRLGLRLGEWRRKRLGLDALQLQWRRLDTLEVVPLSLSHWPVDAACLLLLLAHGALAHRRLVALTLDFLLPSQSLLLAPLLLVQSELVAPGLDVGFQQGVGRALLELSEGPPVGAAQNVIIALVDVAGQVTGQPLAGLGVGAGGDDPADRSRQPGGGAPAEV